MQTILSVRSGKEGNSGVIYVKGREYEPTQKNEIRSALRSTMRDLQSKISHPAESNYRVGSEDGLRQEILPDDLVLLWEKNMLIWGDRYELDRVSGPEEIKAIIDALVLLIYIKGIVTAAELRTALARQKAIWNDDKLPI